MDINILSSLYPKKVDVKVFETKGQSRNDVNGGRGQPKNDESDREEGD